MRALFRLTAVVLVVLLGLTLGTAALTSPAHAACGDTTAEWVDPTLGSAWSGTLDGNTAFTAVFAPELLGVRAAATVIVVQSGAGTWVHDYDTRWTASLAGVWDYHFEVTPSACTGGNVTAAAGAAVDGVDVAHLVTMTRTL